MTDLEIARQAQPQPITQIASSIGLDPSDLFLYGPHMAKILTPPPPPRGKLVLVTAMTPTPAGEGKTTVAIGLTQALGRLGTRAAVALREPSLGPVFGIKGGATGGGHAQVLPMEDINLHFTGDFHAVTSAANLLSAMIDNHLHQGNPLGIDPRRIEFKRALDMNDRALRHVVLGLGGMSEGVPREGGFELTVANEVMAVMALVSDLKELKTALGRIRVGYDQAGKVVTASDLHAEGAMTALLQHALHPNLVQTLEGQPAFVHMGPFGNIAHGTNSVIATRTALGYADVVVTEAGFGSDLGAEKFFNLVSRRAGFRPDAGVVVATMRALRFHGGRDDYAQPDADAVQLGLGNLSKHLENVRLHGLRPILALNRFPTDTLAEIALVEAFAARHEVAFASTDVHGRGGEGGLELARLVLNALETPADVHPLYPLEASIRDKIDLIATRVYGADGVDYTTEARKAIRQVEREGAAGLPVVIAKTANSLSDDSKKRGLPKHFRVTVTDLRQKLGAGFVVAFMGGVNTLPGLPKRPAAEGITVNAQGELEGLF
jgi:formate--tetrahydrofolate ligase